MQQLDWYGRDRFLAQLVKDINNRLLHVGMPSFFYTLYRLAVILYILLSYRFFILLFRLLVFLHEK